MMVVFNKNILPQYVCVFDFRWESLLVCKACLIRMHECQFFLVVNLFPEDFFIVL